MPAEGVGSPSAKIALALLSRANKPKKQHQALTGIERDRTYPIYRNFGEWEGENAGYSGG